MDEKNLYPLRFTPSETVHPWGRESWLLADLGYVDSEVSSGWLQGNTLSELMQTYLEKVVGDDTFEYYGLQFPVTVKVLNIDGKTPVLVQADDTVAAQRYDSLGRTALWIVLSAQPGARIRIGFKNNLSAQALYEAAQQGRLETLMNRTEVQRGDRFLLEPGVTYAFSGKARILEIAEASSLVFDLNDPEDLVEAFDWVELKKFPVMVRQAHQPSGKMSTPHFRVAETLGPEDRDGFVIHVPLADGAHLTLFPPETTAEAAPKDGLFILPGRRD